MGNPLLWLLCMSLLKLPGGWHLCILPPQVFHFHLRLLRFDYIIPHVPAKSLYTADSLSLSCAPLPHSESDCDEAASIEERIIQDISQLPASKDYLKYHSQAQAYDILHMQL